MKWYVIISTGLLLFCMACDNSSLIFSDDYTTENDRSTKRLDLSLNEGVNFYLIKDFIYGSEIQIDSVEMEDEPIISYHEIVAYDSTNHLFQLNFDANSFYTGDINYDQKGFVLMLDNEIINYGLFWSPTHSNIVDGVVLTFAFTDTLYGSCIELIEAYPSSKFSTKQVNLNDERLISRLATDGKLRSLVSAPKSDSGPEPLPGYLDTIYYYNEIFNIENQGVYGKWKLTSISGGITGGGYEPDFDYLEFIPYGIYQFVRADSLLEFGRVAIAEQTDDDLRITLKVDNSSTSFFSDSEKYIELSKGDVMNLIAPCCDRYNYHFERIE
ncbi:MAG: hypothetical protein PF436_06345 [Prolixibacteraceae bacterium]|jgi:hypothetical protein|nr:hypothetical protein [Prolixibacteraceae bacterium]